MIGVVGPGACDEATLRRAERVGVLLAERGAIVVTGGLGGVMEAAARGVRAGGGRCVGILPGDDRDDANASVSMAIATGLGEARNAIIATTCDALIGVGGAYGTLSEIAMALKMGKRVVSLGSWEIDPAIERATSPEDAVSRVLNEYSSS